MDIKIIKIKKLIPLFLILILGLIFVGCPPPHPQTVQVEVCTTSGLLPNEWCPVKEIRTFTIGQQPTIPCQVHKPVRICAETGRRAVACCPDVIEVAEANAPDFYCRRHARTKQTGVIFVLADLGIQCKIQRYSDEEFDVYACRIGEAGVDYVRTYYPSGDDGLPSVFPYEREADGRWNLDKPNPEYDFNLRRLAVALSKYEVGIYMDMADQCGELEWTSCWKSNANGVWGWHDESDRALAYWKTAVDRVLADIGGPEGNIIGFGNELKHPADADVDAAYIEKWGKPRLDYLLAQGLARPIPFSGSGRFAHKMMGYLSEEDGWYPGYDYVALVEHGIGLVEHTPPGETSLWDWLTTNHSSRRKYGYSTDGADSPGSVWNQIPPEKVGICNKAGNCCGPNTAELVKVVQMFYHAWGNQLYCVEILPRERSDDQPLSALKDESLEAFWCVGIEVFEIDIRRTF